MAGTGIAYPADQVSSTPLYTSTQGRTSLGAAMAGATSSRPLGGLTGVRPGTPANTVTATSTTWTAGNFAGYVDLHASATNGGYFFSFQSGGSGAVTAAGGSARQDIVWVRVDDSNTGDLSGARQVVVDYSANTLTPPARAFVIAIINVPASGGGSPTVTWVAPYTAAAGGILPANSVSTYPAAASYPGQYLDDLALGTLLRSNGTSWITVGIGAWQSYTPTLTNMVIGTGGSAKGTLEWRYEGDQVHVRGALTLGSSGASMGTGPVMSLPVNGQALAVPYQWLSGRVSLYDVSAASTAQEAIIRFNGVVGAAQIVQNAATNITATVPFTWAAGDSIYVDFTYDPA